MATTGSLQAGDVGMTVLRLSAFLVVALVVGLLAVPRVLGYVARFHSDEMLLITVLALCFRVCLLAAKLGYSVALGAFVIGAVIAEAREIGKIERLAEPLRDMFSAVFFVAVGLLIDPRVLAEYAAPIAVIVLAVVLGKVAACTFGTFVAGHDLRSSLRVGMGLAQIGEFSFIIASLGLSLKVTSEFLYPIAVAVSAITTLLTPYLIRSADGLVTWFDRAAPRSLVSHLELYTRWVGGLGGRRRGNRAARWIRKWLWQIALNLALVLALFVGAAFVAQHPPRWLDRFAGADENLKALLWLAALVLGLPMWIATYRKLEALGLLIAEMSVSPTAAGNRTSSIRAIIALTIPLAGIGGMGLFLLALSSALLPPLKVLVVLLLIVALVAGLFWRPFVRLYARAQGALQETLSQPPPPRREKEAPEVLRLLAEAELKSVTISNASPAAGRLIHEVQLRTRSGASIVAIERHGTSLVNPDAEEEILPGDQVLLLGNKEQLARAESLLAHGPDS